MSHWHSLLFPLPEEVFLSAHKRLIRLFSSRSFVRFAPLDPCHETFSYMTNLSLSRYFKNVKFMLAIFAMSCHINLSFLRISSSSYSIRSLVYVRSCKTHFVEKNENIETFSLFVLHCDVVPVVVCSRKRFSHFSAFHKIPPKKQCEN